MMAQPLQADDLKQALKRVIDPEIYQNIVDLGLVYGVGVDAQNRVTVTMTLTTPQCPLGPQIIADVEKTLQEEGAAMVVVDIVWEPMWTPDAMSDELKQELGLLPDEEPLPMELPPPPPPKKKGFLRRLIGF